MTTTDAVPANIYVGQAGWSIASKWQGDFPAVGSHLERYAARFNAVEINSSFYRPHLPKTYERWAASVPDEFRFAVKVPQEITHECRLAGTEALLERFLYEAQHLGGKLGPLLVQLPPSLGYDAGAAADFFAMLRTRFDGAVVFEPRHASWFTVVADELLAQHGISRVDADPIPCPAALVQRPAGSTAYLRLHGTPQIYYSAYTPAALADYAAKAAAAAAAGRSVWTIFDNTAAGAAIGDAVAFCRLMGRDLGGGRMAPAKRRQAEPAYPYC